MGKGKRGQVTPWPADLRSGCLWSPPHIPFLLILNKRFQGRRVTFGHAHGCRSPSLGEEPYLHFASLKHSEAAFPGEMPFEGSSQAKQKMIKIEQNLNRGRPAVLIGGRLKPHGIGGGEREKGHVNAFVPHNGRNAHGCLQPPPTTRPSKATRPWV